MECQSLFADNISALFHDGVVLAGGELIEQLVGGTGTVNIGTDTGHDRHGHWP